MQLALTKVEKKWWQHCQTRSTEDPARLQRKRPTNKKPNKRPEKRNV